jgi:outer membrane protein assembly factor BamE
MRKFILIVSTLGGCANAPMLPSLTPYKMDIQQGNYVTQDMVAKLKPGMTRSQVRFILGTPLIVDPFRTDRWDYVYLFNKGGEVTEQRRFAVIFKDDKLAHLEGDVMPASTAPAKGAAGEKAADTVPPKQEIRTEDKPKATQPPGAMPVTGANGGSVLMTGSGEAASGERPKPEAPNAETGADKPNPEQSNEERGFFGRVLEKLGF